MFKKVAIAPVIGLIAFWAASDAVAQGSWEGKANVPSARRAPSAVEVDGKIYVIGGCHGPTANEEYNPVDDSWRERAPLPNPKRRGMGSCAAEVDGKIYFIGGNQGPAPIRVVDLNDEYNPASNSWTSRASMPTARTGAVAAKVGGKIYVIGGSEGANFYDIVEEYDPTEDAWSTDKEPMPTARAFMAAAVVEDKIYVFGGYDGENILDIVEEYDPVEDSWSSRESMPTARCWLSAAAVSGKIYVIGGNNGQSPLSTTEEYDPAEDAWTNCPGMPTARSHIAAAESGGKIYTLCGFWGENFFNTNEEFTPPESGVGEMPDWGLPRAFSLSQSYPNPFNAAVTIAYTIGHPATVNLMILNDLGQLVWNIQLGFQTAGSYTCAWQGSSLAGHSAPSGVYFYTLVVDGQAVATQRMILMR